MKVLHVVWGLCNGGLETLLVNTVKEQQSRGYKTAVMVVNDLYDPQLGSRLNCPLFLIKRRAGSRNPMDAIKILYNYYRFNADVVHFHEASLSYLFFFKRPHDKWVATCHDRLYDYNTFHNKRIGVYVAISECVLSDIRSRLPETQSMLCYNGIDLSKIEVKTNYPVRPTNIVCVGRLVYVHKCQNIIIEAIDKLVNAGRRDIHIDFIGTGENIDDLRDYIATHKLENYACALGNMDNLTILKNLKNYDLFIQASSREGFGLTAIEAMASGVPAILSNVDGHVEVSDKGKYATLFECGNVDDLAFKIEYCTDHYPEKIAQIAESIKFIEQNFSIKSMVDTLCEIYKH